MKPFDKAQNPRTKSSVILPAPISVSGPGSELPLRAKDLLVQGKILRRQNRAPQNDVGYIAASKDIFKFDCRYFLPDKPCVYHKRDGSVCACSHYQKVLKRMLIIKMGEAGDVLRTTGILRGLRKKYRACHVTWVVSPHCKEVLSENPLVDQILSYSENVLAELQVRSFDLLINLDLSCEGSALATLIKAEKKIGFGMTEAGHIVPLNPEAREWFSMSLRDDFKKANRKTYPRIISEIVGIPYKKDPMILRLSSRESVLSKAFVRENKIRKTDFVVGLNTGAGQRWALKKWRVEGFLELIKALSVYPHIKIVLFGSELEKERNAFLVKNSPVPLILGKTENSVREFFSILNICDLLVTGDTLALHAGLALRKKVIVLFGPTSPWEIELFGLGEKIVAPLDCICCYKNTCDFKPNCMETISADRVFKSIKKFLRT